jgi:hypothetical protein
MMTDGMLKRSSRSWPSVKPHRGQPNQTDVVMIEAQLLGIEDLGDATWPAWSSPA